MTEDNEEGRLLDPTRYGPDWTKRFRELNTINGEDFVLMDDDDNPVDGIVKGTLVFARAGVTEEGDEMGVMFQWAPMGELDPKAAINMFGQVVHPRDVSMLMTGLMAALLCEDLFEEVKALMNAHECKDD